MKSIIIVSKCIKVEKCSPKENLYHFHFKGVCSGEVVNKVILKGKREYSIKKGEEYLMYVQLVSFEAGTLTGVIVKAKVLEECWDKS